MKYILTVSLTALVSVALSYFAFSQYFASKLLQEEEVPTVSATNTVGSMIPELQKDVDMYRDIPIYFYLMDKNLYNKLGALGEELGKDKEISDYISLFYTEAIFKKSPEIQASIKNVISEIRAKKQQTLTLKRERPVLP